MCRGYRCNGFRKLDETLHDRDAIDRARRVRANKELPDLDVPTHKDLQEFWLWYRGNKDIERLTVELVRTQRAIGRVEELRELVQTCWSEATEGSHLVALHQIRCPLQDECGRGEE